MATNLYKPTSRRPADPQASITLMEAAMAQAESALRLAQLAIRMDRGEPPDPLPNGEYLPGPIPGSPLAQREGMLAIGHLALFRQKAIRARDGWRMNVESTGKEPEDG